MTGSPRRPRPSLHLAFEPLEERRLLAPGALDLSFGIDGIVTTDFGAYEDSLAMAVQSGGKIVLAGHTNAGGADNDHALARYLTDGSLDPTFGIDGRVITPISPHPDFAGAVALQPDRKIVVAGALGQVGASGFALVRYNSDGSLDTGFGDGGRVLTETTGVLNSFLGVTVQDDGKIVAVGQIDNQTSPWGDFVVARFLSDGNPDTDFGGTGMIAAQVGDRGGALRDVAVLPNGRIVAAGVVEMNAPARGDFAVARFLSNGSLDATFGNGGLVTTDMGVGHNEAFRMALQDDGKIVLAGSANADNGNQVFALARYESDGTPDSGFGAEGHVLTDLGSISARAYDVAVQSDGKIVAGGAKFDPFAADDFAVVRYHPNGILDTGFGTAGITVTPVSPGGDTAFALAIQDDGNIVLAGYASNQGSGDFAVARYQGGGGAPNQAPTDMDLSPSEIAVNQIIGTPVGQFTTTDPDEGDLHTYALVPGPGDTGNDLFVVTQGNVMRARVSFDPSSDPSYPIRVRSTDLGGLSVEKIFIVRVLGVMTEEFDYGDAPSPYPTLHSVDGARHVLTADGPRLGELVDPEDNGQPHPSALGDDTADFADEDGVTLPPTLFWGTTAGVDVSLAHSPADGLLNAWIDFNGDGDFGDFGEQILTDASLAAGSVHELTFPVPSFSGSITTFARFRLSSVAGLPPSGSVIDGEVEDYEVSIEMPAGSGVVRGQLFLDEDRDGTRDAAEPPLESWIVYLDTNHNGQRDPDEPLDVTDAAGVYILSGLVPGTHAVQVEVPQDWRPSAGHGRLTFAEVIREGVGGVSGLNSVKGVNVSPDGRHVYATSQFGSGIPLFHRDAATGELQYAGLQSLGVPDTGGHISLREITFTPDGQFAFVTAFDFDQMLMYVRNPVTGELHFGQMISDGFNGLTGFDGVYSVQVSPDGVHVYSSSLYADAVCVLRNATTGLLTWLETHRDGVGGVTGLQFAAAVTVSPDGNFVYAVGQEDDAVVVFRRDVSTGRLTLVEEVRRGDPGVFGLDGPRWLDISPDGNHLYVASDWDNTLSVFARDTTTGELSFVEFFQDNVGGVDGMEHAYWVTVSPDGDNVYVAGRYEDAIAVFARDDDTGRLTFLEHHRNRVGGVQGLDGARRLAVSPDGKSVYVASDYDSAVTVFHRDIPGTRWVSMAAGQVVEFVDFGHVRMHDFGDAPDSFGTRSDDDGPRHVVEPGGPRLGALVDGELDGLPHDQALGDDRHHLADEDGILFPSELTPGQTVRVDVLLTHSPANGLLNAWIDFNDDGDFGDAGEQIFTDVSLTAGSDHNLSFDVPPTAALTTVFARFRLSSTPGLLPTGEAADGEVEDYSVFVGQTAGIHGQLFHDEDKDGTWEAGEPYLENWIVYLDTNHNSQRDPGEKYDTTDTTGGYALADVPPGTYAVKVDVPQDWLPTTDKGRLTFAQVFKDGEAGVQGLIESKGVDVSPDGRFVYGFGERGDGFALFDRSAATGHLQYLDLLTDGVVPDAEGVIGLRGIAFSPDDRHAYVIGYGNDQILVYDRDVATGRLSHIETIQDGVNGVDGLDGVHTIQISSDGAFVYTCGVWDFRACVFARDVTTGRLTLIQVLQDGQDSNALGYPSEIAFSPDEEFAHIVTLGDDAIAVFRRNAATGMLTLVDEIRKGDLGGPGLDEARSVDVSPDGKHVYVASTYDDTVTVFTRDITTGELSLVQALQDGVNGVDGLDRAYWITVSPDGKQVYVVGRGDGAVAVFARNPATGRLTFIEVHKDGVGGVDGLAQARKFELSPDGTSVYVASQDDSAVAVFHRDVPGTRWVTLTGGEPVTNLDFGWRQVRPPADIQLSNSVLDVDPPAGTLVGLFSADAPNGSSTFTYELVSGVGAADNASFSIDGDELRTAVALDAGTQTDYSIRVRATDDDGASLDEVFTINLVFVNDPPYGLVLSPSSVAENQPAGTVVGTFTTSDPDTGDSFAYRLVSGSGDWDNGSFRVVGNELRTAVELDHEWDSRVRIRVRTTDAGGLWYERWLDIDIVDANDPPIEVRLYSSGVAENLPAGAFVGNLSTRDFDAGDTHTYQLVAGPGDTDNALFTIAGKELKTTAPLDFEQQASHSIRVQSTDSGGETLAETLSVTVLDAADHDFGDAPGVYASLLAEDGARHQFIPDGPRLGSALDLEFDATPDVLVAGDDLGGDDEDGVTFPAPIPIGGTAEVSIDLRSSPDGLLNAWMDFNADGDWEDAGEQIFTDLPLAGGAVRTPVCNVPSAIAPGGSVARFRLSTMAGLSFTGLAPDGEVEDHPVEFVTAGEIRGGVWNDEDEDGQWDAGEPPSAGWTVFLDRNGNEQLDAGESSTVTDAAGEYSFPHVAPGHHRAVPQPPAGWEPSNVLDPLDFVHSVTNGSGGITGFDFPRSVAVTPDGRYVYVAGSSSDTIAAFVADDAGGQLRFVGAIAHGQDGAALDAPYSVAVSPNGEHIYVAAYTSDAVTVLTLDEARRGFRFVQSLRDGIDGVDGINGARSVIVSPDGQHVYAASYIDDSVAGFSRDEVSGQLTFIERYKDADTGGNSLDGASWVTISGDGEHVYVAARRDHTVTVFDRDINTGRLTYVQEIHDGDPGITGLEEVDSLAVSPDGGDVYAISDEDSSLTVFSRDPAAGTLAFVQVLKDGVGGINGIRDGKAVTVSADGGFVYATGYNDRAVVAFERDAVSGELQFVNRVEQSYEGARGLNGVWALAIAPGGEFVYATGVSRDSLVVLSRDPVSGVLAYERKYEQGDGGVNTLTEPESAAVSSDGRHVYVIGEFHGEYIGDRYDAVTVFSRDPAFGELTFLEVYKDGEEGVGGMSGASSMALSPDGKNLYVASTAADAIAIFRRDPSSGLLSFLEVIRDDTAGIPGLYQAEHVTVSADGTHVLVSSYSENMLTVFSRDPATGSLTFVETIEDGMDGVDGLAGVECVAISPDGKHAYAAASSEDAVGVFQRDAVTGRLTYVETLLDGQDGVNGLDGVKWVAVNPDGKHVYAAASVDDAVAVFVRDPVTGELTFVEMHQDGQLGVDGLNSASCVTVSPDGAYVYVTSSSDDALVVFARDEATGQLTYLEEFSNGSNGVSRGSFG